MPAIVDKGGKILVYNQFGNFIEEYLVKDLPVGAVVLSSATHSVLLFNTPNGNEILMQHPEHESIYFIAIRGCILCAALSPNYLVVICDKVLLVYKLGQREPIATEDGCVLEITDICATHDDLFIFDIARSTADICHKMYQLFCPDRAKFIDEIIVEAHLYPVVRNNKFAELLPRTAYNPENGLYKKNDTWYDIEDDSAVFIGSKQDLYIGCVIARSAVHEVIASKNLVKLDQFALVYIRR